MNENEEKKSINYATFIRVIGTVMILFCHFTQKNQNRIVQMSAQFFNIGVSLFFILSGFLLGTKSKAIENFKGWYMKRIKRIYISYEIFLLMLAAVTWYQGKSILTKDWIFLILGMQGTVVGVLGAEHTWYLTALLICYFVTPIINKWINQKIINSSNMFWGVFLISIVLAFVKQKYVFVLLSPMIVYIIAFYMGKKINHIKFSRRNGVMVAGIMLFVFGARIIMRSFFDGMLIYDRMVVFYTQGIGAFCIFYMVGTFFEKSKVGKGIKFINDISFEIYLVHYMFVVGPVSLFGITQNWILDCILATLVSVITAAIIYNISKIIRYLFNVVS